MEFIEMEDFAAKRAAAKRASAKRAAAKRAAAKRKAKRAAVTDLAKFISIPLAKAVARLGLYEKVRDTLMPTPVLIIP